ncbi:MAG: hypothetical protein ACRYFY_09380, partial [Janthinobacterium lividum]
MDLVSAITGSGEAQQLWAGLDAPGIARSIWDHGQPGLRGLAHVRNAWSFRRAWRQAAGLDRFIADFLQTDRARDVPILPLLFPNGIDPDD